MKPRSLVKWDTKLFETSASRSRAAGTSAGAFTTAAVLGSTRTATGSCCGCIGAQRIRTGGPTGAGVISGTAAIADGVAGGAAGGAGAVASTPPAPPGPIADKGAGRPG